MDEKKNEWADQLISVCPEGATLTKIIENSRQIQSNLTRIQRKLKQNAELLPSDYDYITDRAKTISNYYSNYNRYVRKFINNYSTTSRTYQRGRIIEISTLIESLFMNKSQLRYLKFTLSQNIKLYETIIIREFGLKLSISDNIIRTLDFENRTINKALNFIKNDFIPIRNFMAHVSDDEPWNITISDFEYHCNQGLIGYNMLLEHVNRNLHYYTSRFREHVTRSVVLNQENLEYFE